MKRSIVSKIFTPALFTMALIWGCQPEPVDKKGPAPEGFTPKAMIKQNDPHSFALPGEAKTTHLDLDIKVDFEKRQIRGVAEWTLETHPKAKQVILDTREMKIHKVTNQDTTELVYTLGRPDKILGEGLIIDLDSTTEKVKIHYSTKPGADALQWLSPVQTAGKAFPFLFTQSQAILARTWIPCQDSPGIRFSYNAKVEVPKELMAIMSADNPQKVDPDGIYEFKMKQAIPAYLMALAVGNIEFKSVGKQTGVYAEPTVLDAAVKEFEDMEKMLLAAEQLYGPYRWDRYDLIVLPPSFPFGGMENPRLTFATPTILAGDKSLTALVAHELAHSWSGNLVTNATWDDFWLNEGFTVYFERRIMEALYGKPYANMLAVLGYQDLMGTLEELGPTSRETWLKLDLKGRDPDEGLTDIAYEKGYFLLCHIEKTLGRAAFDSFLKTYFEKHAFQVMTTEGFVKYVDEVLIKGNEELAARLNLQEWIYGPGVPGEMVPPTSERFTAVNTALAEWKEGKAPKKLETADWSTHEWLHFIRKMPDQLSPDQMEKLDKAFGFTNSGNSEIQAAWFMHAIRNNYQAAMPALESFLMRVGRRKFLKPLYKAMAETPEGKAKALEIYKAARANYHSVSTNTLDAILGYSG